jgi:hypothetical protein
MPHILRLEYVRVNGAIEPKEFDPGGQSQKQAQTG